MPLALQDFENGSTDYVGRHNSNNALIVAAFNALQASVSGSIGAAVSVGDAFRALFGSTSAVIGAASYACSGLVTTLTVSPGYAWNSSTGMVTQLATLATISFAGVSAGTYYISAGPTGAPQRNTSAVGALYSVVWSGSAFGAITRVAAISWAQEDWVAAQSSAAYSLTYPSLDLRLEATEAQVGSAGLARTNQVGRLLKTLAGVSETLTALEANQSVIEFTGTITAALNVVVPVDGPRQWLVINNTTGNFRITFKPAAGAGVILPGSGGSAVIYHTGTNTVLSLVNRGLITLPSAASLTADFARADTVRITLTANSTITLAGAIDGQKCLLEVAQDATGGRTLGFGAEVRFGQDLAAISLSTTASVRHRLGFIYHAASSKYDLVAQARGF